MVSSLEMLKATPAAGGGVPVPVSGGGEAVERAAPGSEGTSEVERLEPLF
jgi:hypothetical protein